MHPTPLERPILPALPRAKNHYLSGGAAWHSAEIGAQGLKTGGREDVKKAADRQLRGLVEQHQGLCMIHLLADNLYRADHPAAKCPDHPDMAREVRERSHQLRYPIDRCPICFRCGLLYQWGQPGVDPIHCGQHADWQKLKGTRNAPECRYADLVPPLAYLTNMSELGQLREGVWERFSPEDEQGVIPIEGDNDNRYIKWLSGVEASTGQANIVRVWVWVMEWWKDKNEV